MNTINSASAGDLPWEENKALEDISDTKRCSTLWNCEPILPLTQGIHILRSVLGATKDYVLEEKQTHNIGLQGPLGTIIPYLCSNKWLR